MARPRLAPGTIGAISVERRGTRYLLRARIRDDSGTLLRISGLGDTYEEAHALLLDRASRIDAGPDVELTPTSTIAQACEAWLEQVRSSRQNPLTIERYEDEVRTVVVPICGDLLLRDATVFRVDRIIRRTLEVRSLSAARRLRKILSMVFGMVARYGVIDSNPIRDVQRLPASPKKQSYLTPEQLALVWRLASDWRSPDGRDRPDRDKLHDVSAIIVATSARISEVLALRRSDVSVSGLAGEVRIAATLQQTRRDGLVRKPSPKHERQKRVVTLPEFAVEAVRRRLALSSPDEDSYLFATASGAAYSGSNFQRLWRAFREAHAEQLAEAGIDLEEFTSHVLRRTAATYVERAGGITLSSRLLGHANESITRASYVVSDERVDPRTAEIIDLVFGSGGKGRPVDL